MLGAPLAVRGGGDSPAFLLPLRMQPGGVQQVARTTVPKWGRPGPKPPRRRVTGRLRAGMSRESAASAHFFRFSPNLPPPTPLPTGLLRTPRRQGGEPKRIVAQASSAQLVFCCRSRGVAAPGRERIERTVHAAPPSPTPRERIERTVQSDAPRHRPRSGSRGRRSAIDAPQRLARVP